MARKCGPAWLAGLMVGLLAAACGPATTVPPTLPATPPAPTLIPATVPSAPPTAPPTATPFPTPVPRPTLLPTLDPATLPDLLSAAFSLQQEAGIEGHPLLRLTGWGYGLRSSGYCQGPYRWLDSGHLLLFPLAGQEEGMGVTEWTLPLVANLRSGATWLPPMDGRDGDCFRESGSPLWSEALQLLVATQGGEVVLLDADGSVRQRFPGGGPLYLSPSGRRLLAGFVWGDLESGEQVDFTGQGKETMINPAWSADETRLFDCCFLYADAVIGRYARLALGSLSQRGVGVGSDFPGITSRWGGNDTRVIVEWDFFQGDKPGAIPLINPAAQVYTDVRAMAGLPLDEPCGSPRVAPDGKHLWVRCGPLEPAASGSSYLIDLEAMAAQKSGGALQFISWSADSKFVLVGRNLNPAAREGEYLLFSVAGGEMRALAEGPLAAPTWAPQGGRIAFLAGDRRTLTVLGAADQQVTQSSLPQPVTLLSWRPQGDGLAALAEDGRLWWVSDLAGAVDPLTPTRPAVRDLRWSPDGEYLAFVSAADVYVVSIHGGQP